MKKTATDNKKQLQELKAKLKVLQAELVRVNKLEGEDAYIDVTIHKNQARFQKSEQKNQGEKAIGKFFIEVHILAQQQDVFVPISVASGKKTAGFMYQIEGTALGQIATTDIKIRGDGVSLVTLGTLQYAKIPTGVTAFFQIQTTIRGVAGKRYKIVFTRLNYKLQLSVPGISNILRSCILIA